jgi:hypothetical protein
MACSALPPRKIPDTHFCYNMSETQGQYLPGNIRSTEKSDVWSGIEPATIRLVAVLAGNIRSTDKSVA